MSYLLENYARLPVTMVKGQGSSIWDSAGKHYLDLFVGFGGGGVCGHSHPAVTKSIAAQAALLSAHGNLFSNPVQEKLAEKLVEVSFPGKVFFCHSGAEADEAALKLIRKRTSGNRFKVISFHNSFHGRTFGGLSLTPPSFQEGLGPMLPGNLMLPFNDVNALESALEDDEVGGIILEPIQGEGGINEISSEFVSAVASACQRKDLILVCDEVWSGPGRTGKWFAYQHTDLKPDIVTCAKALGGGLPLACMIVSEKFADVLGPGTHGCTLGGNPVCAAAGLSVMELIESESLLARATELGNYATQQLAETGEHVRGKGLMLGVQLSKAKNSSVFNALLNEGVIVGAAKNNVLRIAPAMNISENELAGGVAKIVKAIREQS